jgi:hypothetical protein
LPSPEASTVTTAERTPSTPPPKPSAPAARPNIAGVPLEEVDAFVDLSSEMHQHLVNLARVETLASDEEVSSFGAALLLTGDASVCATIVDAPACRAAMRTLVPARGSRSDAIAIRVVAGPQGAQVAVWEQAVIEEALKPCPRVIEELVQRADRLQALVGVTMGPLGDLDEAARSLLVDKLTVRAVQPFEVIAVAGASNPSIVLVGVGTIEILAGEEPERSLRSGDMLFARAVLEAQPSPAGARAGATGALILTGEAKIAQQLFVSTPPLVAVLSGDDGTS